MKHNINAFILECISAVKLEKVQYALVRLINRLRQCLNSPYQRSEFSQRCGWGCVLQSRNCYHASPVWSASLMNRKSLGQYFKAVDTLQQKRERHSQHASREPREREGEWDEEELEGAMNTKWALCDCNMQSYRPPGSRQHQKA